MLHWQRQSLSRLPHCRRSYLSCSSEFAATVVSAARCPRRQLVDSQVVEAAFLSQRRGYNISPAVQCAATTSHGNFLNNRLRDSSDRWRHSSLIFTSHDTLYRQHSTTSPGRDVKGREQQLMKFGHDYTQVGGTIDPSICKLTEDEIHELIRERIQSRRATNFREADMILQKLEKSGVELDDKLKEWRADVLNKFGHSYTQVGGPIDPSICTFTEKDIHRLLRERTQCQHVRDFQKADMICERLRKSGVKVEDRLKEWRADGVFADGTRMRSSQAIGLKVDDRLRESRADDGLRADGTRMRPSQTIGVNVYDMLEESRTDRTRYSQTTVTKFGHDYTQVGGPIDPSLCTLPVSEIHTLIRERTQRKHAREFQKADKILEKLRQSGVEVDDKLKEWRADVLNKFGHDYTQIGGPIDPSICNFTENEIHKLLQKRTRCQHVRDFQTTDMIREKLRKSGVKVDDRLKEWRADGLLADGTRMKPSQTIDADETRDSQTNVTRFGHDYTQVGGRIDPSICALPVDKIHTLIRERMQCKGSRDFQRADKILEKLRHNGVEVDDTLKEWRAHVLNKFGHDYTYIGGPIDPYSICILSENEIHKLIRARMQCKRAHNFEKADLIEEQMRRVGVEFDDKRRLWKFAPRKNPSSKSEDTTTIISGPRMHETTIISSPRMMKDCQTIEEAIEVTLEESEQLTTRNISAFWAVAPRLLHEWITRPEHDEFSASNQLGIILSLTLGNVESFNPRELSATALGFAKIMKIVGTTHGKEFPEDSPLRARMQCKRALNFQKAEMIQEQMRRVGVDFDDKRKLWTFTPSENPSSKYKDTATIISSPMNAIRTMKDCQTIEEAIEVTIEESEQLTTRDISAFWAVAPRLLHEWIKRPVHEKFSASNQLGIILSLTLRNVESFSPRELSTTTLGLAKIMKIVGTTHGKEFPEDSPHQKLHDLLLDPEMKHQILNKIANASMAILPEFDARILGNISYAYALADHSPKIEDGSALFVHLAEKTIPLLGTFEPQELSDMLWAYSTLGISNSDLFQKAGDIIVSLDNLRLFTEQALSNIVWSYATVKERHPELFKKVSDHVVSLDNLDKFRAQTLSNILWAYASADESHLMLFKKTAGHIVLLDNLDEFRVQHLSNIPWAYATAKESHPLLFQKIANAAIKRQNEFNPQCVANFLWAYATNGQIDQHLFSSLAPSVEILLRSCNTQELANVAWAYAVANVAAPSTFNDAFINACLEKEDEFIIKSLCQLHQWQLWQKELESSTRLPPSLQKKCYEAFISRGPGPSLIQDDVTAELFSIGLTKKENLTERGYRLDALVDVNGNKIGIEVDGPFHFVGRKPAGRTILKHRQITNLEGIRVASIPYWEWEELGMDSGKKQIYLRLLLGLF